jgi:hypothetical protein
MSYLNPTRVHFSGQFRADVSTVNNDDRHFNSTVSRTDRRQRRIGDVQVQELYRGTAAAAALQRSLCRAAIPLCGAAIRRAPSGNQQEARWRFTRSMPEVARCDTIEVGETVVRAGSKIEACDEVEQALMGAIRDRDRQRFIVKSFDVAAD